MEDFKELLQLNNNKQPKRIYKRWQKADIQKVDTNIKGTQNTISYEGNLN